MGNANNYKETLEKADKEERIVINYGYNSSGSLDSKTDKQKKLYIKYLDANKILEFTITQVK